MKQRTAPTKISEADWKTERSAERNRHLLSGLELRSRASYRTAGEENPALTLPCSQPNPRGSTWREHAECLGLPLSLFFSSNEGKSCGPQLAPAIKVCERCRVREECLLDALETDNTRSPSGIRGGKTVGERRNILKQWKLLDSQKENNLTQRKQTNRDYENKNI